MSWRCCSAETGTPRESWAAWGTGKFRRQLGQHSLDWVCIPPQDAAVGPIKLPWGWFGQQAPLCPCSCFLGLPAKPGSTRWAPAASLSPLPSPCAGDPSFPEETLSFPWHRDRGSGFDTSSALSWGYQEVALGPGPRFPVKDGARWRDRIPTSPGRVGGGASRTAGLQLSCGFVAVSAPPRSPACLFFSLKSLRLQISHIFRVTSTVSKAGGGGEEGDEGCGDLDLALSTGEHPASMPVGAFAPFSWPGAAG